MSDFNAEAFMQTEIEGVGETEYTPIPEAEYPAVIKEVKADSTPKGSPFLELIWIIDDEEVRELVGQDEPQVRHAVWLDINENGALEFGKNKNIKLNQLREALGQNDGKPWSPTMLIGCPATVSVKHRLGNEGQVFAEIKGVRA